MRHNKLILLIIILLIIDQFTKFLASHLIDKGGEIYIVENIIGLTYKENRGLVFSIGDNIEWFFVISVLSKTFAFIILIMFYRYYIFYFRSSKMLSIACAFLLSCWLGNIIDLTIWGYIRDMILWPGPGTPNMADIYFYIGFAFLCIELVKNPTIDIKGDIICATYKDSFDFIKRIFLFAYKDICQTISKHTRL